MNAKRLEELHRYYVERDDAPNANRIAALITEEKMNQHHLKELVDKLEIITNGGENDLTQDDYGDLYDILFVKLNDMISKGQQSV
jgi:hypothetical protein